MIENLREFCRKTLGGGYPLEIADLTPMTDGWECEVDAFALIEGGARRELILRRYQGRDAGRKAEAEFAILRQLGDVGYPVPRALALATEDSPLAQPFVIMEKIEGPSLGSLLRQSNGKSDRDALQRLSDLLARLHALDWRAVASDRHFAIRGGLDRWVAWIRAAIAEFRTDDYDAALDWIEQRAARVVPRPLTIVHQDFHPWNILVRPDGQAFVIDWTQADLLDPRLDLAWTLLLMTASLGAEARDLVLAEYETRAGAVPDLDVFEIAAAVKRLATITLALSGGAEKLGMRPGAEAKIREQVGHLQTAYAVLRDRSALKIRAVEEILGQ